MTDNDKILYANTSKEKCSALGLCSNEEKETSNVSDSSETIVLNEEIENKLIDALVKYKSKEELTKTKFYFMSANIQCVARDGYRPLEIGIIEYTIGDGIRLNYHQFIDCGEVPYGHGCEAKDHAQTHKIPLKNFLGSSNDYLMIESRILELLSNSCPKSVGQQINKPMIVFSKTEQIDQNRGALKWISRKSNEMRQQNGDKSYHSNIEVLSASKLLHSILTAAGDCRSMGWCENVITSHAFDYAIGTDCAFHEEVQSIYCAIGVPKRMAYLMSHFLRESYDIRLLANQLQITKAFENLRIKEEDEEEEEAFELKDLIIEMVKDMENTQKDIKLEEKGGLEEENEADVKNKAIVKEEEGFEQQVIVSHIRRPR